jgi:hypothetical protein
MLRPRAVALAVALGGVAGWGWSSSGGGPRDGGDARDADAGAPEAPALSRVEAGPGGGGGSTGDDARGETDGDAARDARGEADGADALEAGAAVEAPLEAGATPNADAAPADRDAPAEAGPPKLCAKATRTLTVPSGPVDGLLAGASDNDIVSCQNLVPTYGPDAAYTLTVDHAALVEIRVDPSSPVFVALRASCLEGISELGCSGDAEPLPGASFDGGLGADGSSDGGGLDGSGPDAPPPVSSMSVVLRAHLAPGTYTIVIDRPSDGPKETTFRLWTTLVPPGPNALCASPRLLTGPSLLPDERLDLGLPGSPGCGAGAGPTLYYAVGVPSGQRLSVRASPKVGDRPWMPRLEAFASCGTGACLAAGHASSGTTQQLDWINNGAAWRLVLVAVSADGPVNGATFELSVGVADQMATCARPTVVTDGSTLLNQDLRAAPTSETLTCAGVTARALYYAANVLEGQTLQITSAGRRSHVEAVSPAAIGLRTACGGDCMMNGTSATYTNASDSAQTIIIEVAASTAFGTENQFDLSVSMPPPPAGIKVVAPDALVTTEAGGTATFQIVLASPPASSVTISLQSDTPGEATVSPAALVFDAKAWDVPQVVTVTGADDQLRDGPRPFTIVTGAAVSADARYSGFSVDDVSGLNLDDEPGLTLVGAEGLATGEWGGKATFQVRLNRAPTADVHVPLASTNVAEGKVSPAELVFSPTSWSTPQTVTVTGVDDVATDGLQAYAIAVGALTSADASYAGLDPADLVVHNRDDDLPAVKAKLVSGDHMCSSSSNRILSVDGFGRAYVLLRCSDGLFVTTSADGGATFSEPILVRALVDTINDVQLAAGRGGEAYVLVADSSVGVELSRTTDGGATWLPPRKLLPPPDPNQGHSVGTSRLVVGRGQVFAMALGYLDGPSSFLWRSVDGGRTFQPRSRINSTNLSLSATPDGQTVLLVGDQQARKSTDGGSQFSLAGTIAFDLSMVALGDQSLVAVSGAELDVLDVPSFSNLRTLTTNIGNPVDVGVDDADVFTVLSLADAGSLQAARLPADKSGLVDVKTLGPNADAAALAVLSRRTAATAFVVGNLVLFSSATW